MTSPYAGDGARRTPRRWVADPRRVLSWVATSAAVLVLVFSSAAYTMIGHFEGALHRIDVFGGLSGRPERTTGDATNFLLVGSDTRTGLSRAEHKRLTTGGTEVAEGQRSDTIILAHISGRQDKATLVSFPRDSLVRIPAYTDASGDRHPPSHGKLNAAYSLGGPSLTVATIEQSTGIRIDHYLEVDFGGFVRMVDALGGVDVCLPQAVNDRKSGLNLPAGRSHVDGVQGLSYVRARYFDPRADIGRIERQQKFLGAMMSRATSTGVLLNPIKLKRFLDAALGSVRTDPDLERSDIVTLATKLRGLSPQNVRFLTVPVADPNFRAGLLGSVVKWDQAAAKTLFQRIRDDEPVVKEPRRDGGRPSVAAASIRVRVLNAAGAAGLAARVSADLAAAGFSIAAEPTNADTTGAAATVIRYDARYTESVKTLAAALPGARLEKVEGLGATLQVLAGSSYDGLAAVKVSPSGSPSSPQALQSRTAAEDVCS